MQSYLSVLSKKHSAAAAGGSGASKPPQRGGRRGGREDCGRGRSIMTCAGHGMKLFLARQTSRKSLQPHGVLCVEEM